MEELHQEENLDKAPEIETWAQAVEAARLVMDNEFSNQNRPSVSHAASVVARKVPLVESFLSKNVNNQSGKPNWSFFFRSFYNPRANRASYEELIDQARECLSDFDGKSSPVERISSNCPKLYYVFYRNVRRDDVPNWEMILDDIEPGLYKTWEDYFHRDQTEYDSETLLGKLLGELESDDPRTIDRRWFENHGLYPQIIAVHFEGEDVYGVLRNFLQTLSDRTGTDWVSRLVPPKITVERVKKGIKYKDGPEEAEELQAFLSNVDEPYLTTNMERPFVGNPPTDLQLRAAKQHEDFVTTQNKSFDQLMRLAVNPDKTRCNRLALETARNFINTVIDQWIEELNTNLIPQKRHIRFTDYDGYINPKIMKRKKVTRETVIDRCLYLYEPSKHGSFVNYVKASLRFNFIYESTGGIELSDDEAIEIGATDLDPTYTLGEFYTDD